MALTVSNGGTASWVSPGTRSITISPSAGDVIAFIVAAADPAITVTGVTDNLGGTWTAGPDIAVSTGNLRAVTYYKICSGSETSVSFTIGGGTTGQAFAVRVTGFTGTATLEGTPGEDDTKISTIGTTVGSGSSSNTTASAVAIALFASDRADTIDGGGTRNYTNSFTEVGFNSTSGSRAGAWAAAKVLSGTGSNSTTFSVTDTGDELYGAILVFGDVTSGGNTISVPVGNLALTGFAPTVIATANQLIAVPSGSLSLTGFAPTVLNGANQVIQVPVGSLVLTGYAPTVVSTANQTIAVPAGSLVITGYAPTVRVGNEQIVVVPAGSLTLTGYAPTIVTTNNKFISVPVGTLVLTGYAPTVLGGEISNRGSRSWTESERRLNERLRRLALQQARWEDDEEALAILLASIIRR